MNIFKIFAVLYLLKRYSDETGMPNLVGKTRLHKLLFLSKMEGGLKEVNYFEFRPYYYGPYSFDLKDIIEDMTFHGWITEERIGDMYIYKLTEEGKKFLENLEEYLKSENPEIIRLIKESIDNVIKQYKDYSIKKLIEYVYKKYPDFAPKPLDISW
jgi:uncharacterized protein YwgA